MRAAPGAALSLLVTATILLTVHATLLVFHPEATLFSNLLILSMPLLATILCLLGAHTEGKETKSLWLLLGAGFLLATVGQLGWTYSAFAAHLRIRIEAFNFDFFFFAYGIPILLAICSGDKDAGLKSFAWLDGQALVPAMTTAIFGFRPTTYLSNDRPMAGGTATL
jgi:hypothetical protein